MPPLDLDNFSIFGELSDIPSPQHFSIDQDDRFNFGQPLDVPHEPIITASPASSSDTPETAEPPNDPSADFPTQDPAPSQPLQQIETIQTTSTSTSPTSYSSHQSPEKNNPAYLGSPSIATASNCTNPLSEKPLEDQEKQNRISLYLSHKRKKAPNKIASAQKCHKRKKELDKKMEEEIKALNETLAIKDEQIKQQEKEHLKNLETALDIINQQHIRFNKLQNSYELLWEMAKEATNLQNTPNQSHENNLYTLQETLTRNLLSQQSLFAQSISIPGHHGNVLKPSPSRSNIPT